MKSDELEQDTNAGFGSKSLESLSRRENSEALFCLELLKNVFFLLRVQLRPKTD